MGLLLANAASAGGGGGGGTTVMEDSFNRTSSDLDGDTPDVTNDPGNTWSIVSGTVKCVASGGGYATNSAASGAPNYLYDMGGAATRMTANVTYDNLGSRFFLQHIRYVDASNTWRVEGNDAAASDEKVRIIFRTSGTNYVRAGNGATTYAIDNKTHEIDTTFVGTTIETTWDNGTDNVTVTYPLDLVTGPPPSFVPDNLYDSATKVGFVIRDLSFTDAQKINNFRAEV